MKHDWTPDQISYSLEIDPGHLQLIIDHDSTLNNFNEQLAGRIDALEGLSDTNYGEHLGPYIFINIDFPDDHYQTRDKIDKLINDYTAHAILVLIFAGDAAYRIELDHWQRLEDPFWDDD
jgi:hypothetical protein